MESGHAEVAVLLIEAGADRHRVCVHFVGITRHKAYVYKNH